MQPTQNNTPHQFYKDGDANIPSDILDQSEGGQVCLSLCKVCGQAEIQLEPFCPGPKQAATPAPASAATMIDMVGTAPLADAELAEAEQDAFNVLTEGAKGGGGLLNAAECAGLLARLAAAEALLAKTAAPASDELLDQTQAAYELALGFTNPTAQHFANYVGPLLARVRQAEGRSATLQSALESATDTNRVLAERLAAVGEAVSSQKDKAVADGIAAASVHGDESEQFTVAAARLMEVQMIGLAMEGSTTNG